MTTLQSRKSIGRQPLRRAFLLIPLVAFACFALSPHAHAQVVCRDGCDLTYGNTFQGADALKINTGSANTAFGAEALSSNTTGNQNTAIGNGALDNNTTASFNTATGSGALYTNTTGQNNMADGFKTLYFNTTGSDNTAIGFIALAGNTTGLDNTATGSGALSSNTTGAINTATGFDALYSNTTAKGNTAVGYRALYSENGSTSSDGAYNTAVGNSALANTTTGYENIGLGQQAGSALTTGNYNIDIGNSGVAGEGNTIRIGDSSDQTATFIAGIYGVNENGIPLAVYINSNGQLGTLSSSLRFKKEIKPMDETSQAILALKPVTFQYKSDTNGTPQFGLIAEEVEKVNPDLVVRDADGKPYSVRYEAVNAMLLNEFLKEHRTVQELKSTAAKQEATIARQQKQIEALTTGLQNVSAQLELSKSAPQMAGNDR